MSHYDPQDDARDTGPAGADFFVDDVLKALTERQFTTANGARQHVADHLMANILDLSGFDPAQMLDEMRGFRLGSDQIIDIYITEAARDIGQRWVDDTMDFATVTIAALRLQLLLGEITGGWQPMDMDKPGVPTALVIIPENEQHLLGPCVVAAQLQRMGWATLVSFCETSDSVIDRARACDPDLVVYSCAQKAALEYVGSSVLSIRNAVARPPVFVLGGSVEIDPTSILEITGVDLVSSSLRDVAAFCAKRMKALADG